MLRRAALGRASDRAATLTRVTASEEFLHQLDATSDDGSFPFLDNGYYYAIDARLHVYRDATRWAVIVEAVGYNPRGYNVIDKLHYYGNCLTPADLGVGDFLDRLDNMADVCTDDDRYAGDTPVVVRGQAIAVDGRAGERFEDFARRLVPGHRDLLLADESELRSRIPADLPEILRLEEWHHPDPYADEPSRVEAFQLLADVLETGDVSRYRPTQSPNTHWSYWPGSGTL